MNSSSTTSASSSTTSSCPPRSRSSSQTTLSCDGGDPSQHEGVATSTCSLPPACGILRSMPYLPNSGHCASLSRPLSSSSSPARTGEDGSPKPQTQTAQARYPPTSSSSPPVPTNCSAPVGPQNGGIRVLRSQTSYFNQLESGGNLHCGDGSFPESSYSSQNSVQPRPVPSTSHPALLPGQQYDVTVPEVNRTGSLSSSPSSLAPSRSSVRKRCQTQQVLWSVDSEGVRTWKRTIVEYH